MDDERHHRQSLISLHVKTMDVYSRVDRIVEKVVHLVSGGEEHRIACRRGCNACCGVFVRATFAEAVAIAGWLLEPSGMGRLNHFRNKMTRWNMSAGPEIAMLEALATRRDVHFDSGSDSALFADAVRAYHRRRLMCPFNADDGSCWIYDFRPIVCRAWLVVDGSENCGFDAKGEARVVRHAKLTEIVFLGHKTLREASAVLGYGTIAALPVAAHRAVAFMEQRA